MTHDQYGSVLREKMKDSMSEPFVPRNRRVSNERRANWIQSWWIKHHEDVGCIAWSVLVFMVAFGVIWVYGTWPR